ASDRVRGRRAPPGACRLARRLRRSPAERCPTGCAPAGTLARTSPHPKQPSDARLACVAPRALAPGRVFDDVFHVLADLAQIVAHGELEVGIVLHRAPEEVLAARLAVDAAGALGGSDLVQIAEQHGHRA